MVTYVKFVISRFLIELSRIVTIKTNPADQLKGGDFRLACCMVQIVVVMLLHFL